MIWMGGLTVQLWGMPVLELQLKKTCKIKYFEGFGMSVTLVPSLILSHSRYKGS